MRRFAALLLLAAGCHPGSSPDITAAREEIRTVIRSYHELLSKGDVEGAAALAAPEFSIVSGGENPVYGREAAIVLLKGFVDVYKEKDLVGKREPRYGEIRIDVRDGLAVATYSVTFLEPKGPFHESYTQLFARKGGTWLLLHEHRAPRTLR